MVNFNFQADAHRGWILDGLCPELATGHNKALHGEAWSGSPSWCTSFIAKKQTLLLLTFSPKLILMRKRSSFTNEPIMQGRSPTHNFWMRGGVYPRLHQLFVVRSTFSEDLQLQSEFKRCSFSSEINDQLAIHVYLAPILQFMSTSNVISQF